MLWYHNEYRGVPYENSRLKACLLMCSRLASRANLGSASVQPKRLPSGENDFPVSHWARVVNATNLGQFATGMKLEIKREFVKSNDDLEKGNSLRTSPC